MASYGQDRSTTHSSFPMHPDNVVHRDDNDGGSSPAAIDEGRLNAWKTSDGVSDATESPTTHARSPQSSVSTAFDRHESSALLLPQATTGKTDYVDEAQDSSLKQVRQAIKIVWNDWWVVELGACLVAAILMAVLASLLNHYKEKPLDDIPLYIGVNTILAICSKVISLMIGLALAASISQYKWCWYRQRHSLDAMEVFDEASRGAEGSLYLVFSKRVG